MAQQKSRQRVIVIVGPTASGKSALAVRIAKHIGGEIISADSRQVYRGLDIGTGKITTREMRGVPHHLLDVASPKKIFSANDFVLQGRAAIAEIAARGHVPIICGGTGFYIDALIGRITLPNVAIDMKLRARLEVKTPPQLFAMLKKRDPRRATTIEPHNKRRLIRALEIAAHLGKTPPPRLNLGGYDAVWIGLLPSKEQLRSKISKRLRYRLQQGMITEAKRLHRRGLSYKRMQELGLEYRSLARFLQKKISRIELEQELQSAIWRYTRKQLMYWRRNPDIRWSSNAVEAKKRVIR
ncbi:MAG TPA: tRNA (adenosine(37)-N6)-dimethylallyltransferase MiaA [Candidatus Paceibacterota bacterium]|nr:tRNA (adenosine(37)-N6)-dimethylallyltransferase MiaA [Candidatus Paceibacterota bacterium]